MFEINIILNIFLFLLLLLGIISLTTTIWTFFVQLKNIPLLKINEFLN